MAETVLTTSGASITLDAGDKITSIAGQSRDLYVVEIGPWTQGDSDFGLVFPVDVDISRFDEVDTGTLTPVYLSSVTAEGQPKTEKFKYRSATGDQSDANFGPNAPESREILYFENADSSKDYGLIRARLADASRGLMFPAMFTAQYIPEPTETGGDPDLYIEPTYTPGTAVDLTLSFIDLSEQMAYQGGAGVKIGDAVIKVSRDQLTHAQIIASKGLFTITPIGGSSDTYQVWGSDGVKYEQTYHWLIYLKRVRS